MSSSDPVANWFQAMGVAVAFSMARVADLT
jgi:hypothetical protein